MLEGLLPTSVAWAESREDLPDVELPAVELDALGAAVDGRRREFITGRACARRALGRLGAPVVAIPSGAHGEPRWPAGVVGSITHCRGYRASAVAWSRAVLSLGIDAEPDAPLPDGVLEDVVHGRELPRVAGARGGGGPDLGRLHFSAKEAVFKAWFPLAGRWLGFEDVELTFDLELGAFRAELLVPGPVVGGARLTELRGRWRARDGLLCTAVTVPAGGRRGA